MPDVIDLVSSTPPSAKPQAPSKARAAPTVTRQPPISSSPRPGPAPSQFSFSDDIDFDNFAFEEFDEKPATKRLRLSEELKSPQLPDPAPYRRQPRSPKKSSLFRFSDDGDDQEGFWLLKRAPWPLRTEDDTRKGFKKDMMSASWENVEESDPIVFTSSAPIGEPDTTTSNGKKVGPAFQKTKAEIARTNTIAIDSDDDDDEGKTTEKVTRRQDEIEDFSDKLQPLPDADGLIGFSGDFGGGGGGRSGSGLSTRTASLLASLNSRPSIEATTKKSRSGKGKDTSIAHDDLSDNLVEPAQPKRKTTTNSSKPTTEEKAAKARTREVTKAQRERERQQEKDRKAKLKEDKAKEKQLAADLAQVNKSKVDKKESTPEMIIDMDSSLEGSSVGNQAVEFMKRLDVEYSFFQSSIRGLVKWRRKVQAKYNEGLGYWEPCARHIQTESHVLCLLTAQDFADMVIAPDDSDNNLERHVLRIKSAYPGCKPIYLIEGLTAWMRKNHNARNRAYQAEVRRQFNDETLPSSSSNNRRTNTNNTKKPETTPPIPDDTIEDALLTLQVTHASLIHHTSGPVETAEWLKTFTEHISTIPYRLEVMQGNDSAFCMDVGQVKTGEDKRDTFVKMLQEINRVTASMAYGIVERYPSVVDLVEGMKGVHGGVGMLEDVKKSANKNGTLTDARIGPAVSRRLYKVFMGLDPSSTDI